jgi:hypothetical protein
MAINRKPRSPKYPHLTLSEAIERVGQVYRAERTHKVEKKAVALDLGYGGLNGASTSLIGTLKNYDLLHEDKEGVEVTGDAVTILRAPEGDPDRAEALLKAAFAPKVFTELREAYGDDPSELPNNTAIQYRLEKRGFLEKAASEVIRIYRDNLEFVSGELAEYTVADEPVEQQPLEVEVQPQQPVDTPSVPHHGSFGAFAPIAPVEQESGAEVLQYRISGDSRVRLLFDGAVTKEAIEKLMAYLDLAKDDYPSKDQLEPHMATQPAEQTVIEMPAPEQGISE